MSTVWFTADLHIGHRMVAELREYSEPEWHDEDLANAWDAVVAPDDDVWILGDLSAGGQSSQRKALGWVAARPGRKHLIAGNHDGIHPMHRDAHKWVGEYGFVFHVVAPAARRRHDGTEYLLSHFPYTGDHTDVQRYDQWRLPDLGTPVIHGHTHQTDRVTLSPNGTRQIHVGVDAWGLVPVPLHRVAALLKGHDDE